MQDPRPARPRPPSPHRRTGTAPGPLADTAAFLRAFGLSGELIEPGPAHGFAPRGENEVCVLGYN
jgi:hypothetical protein